MGEVGLASRQPDTWKTGLDGVHFDTVGLDPICTAPGLHPTVT